ncbi:MAG: caspase family protein [Myxococcota bacterium]
MTVGLAEQPGNVRFAQTALAWTVRLLVACSVFGATAARAESAILRLAVVVGANTGEADEVRLRYAELDALRIADVLLRLGDTGAENLLLLRGVASAEVERVLGTLRERVVEWRTRNPDGKVQLLFYYSGHASVAALHLGGTRMPFASLRTAVAAVGADVNLLVVDACRSGGLTRLKGAKAAAPFEMVVEDHLDTAGTAILTSSAPAEDAQESDRLRGGIFTHHLLAGLSGAADASRDQRVTLAEAQHYAYDQTVRSTTETRFVQHPTYAFALQGGQPLVLTRLTGAAGLGRLRLVDPGAWVLMDRDRQDAVVAEVDAQPRTELLIATGRYLARLRALDAVYERELSVSAAADADVAAVGMTRLPYGVSTRRGLIDDPTTSLTVGVETTGSLLLSQDASLGGAVGLGLDLTHATLNARVRYGHSSAKNADLTGTQDIVGMDVAGFRMVEWPDARLGFGLGVRLGTDLVLQRFETTGVAPDRSQLVGRIAPVARVEFSPTSRLAVTVDCGGDTYLTRMADGDGRRWRTSFVPFCALSAGTWLP